MRRRLSIPFVLALAWGPILAANPQERATNRQLSPFDVISLKGQLNARDRIRAYTLKKDGSFSSFPMGMSGTWVQGKWKLESSSQGLRVHVEGKWGGVNQLSPDDQFITMQVMIQPGTLQDTGHPETDSYTCSVVVSDTKTFTAPRLKITPFPPLTPSH